MPTAFAVGIFIGLQPLWEHTEGSKKRLTPPYAQHHGQAFSQRAGKGLPQKAYRADCQPVWYLTIRCGFAILV